MIAQINNGPRTRGAHGFCVVALASEADLFRAVIAQVPFIDGLSTARYLRPSYALRGIKAGLRDIAHALK